MAKSNKFKKPKGSESKTEDADVLKKPAKPLPSPPAENAKARGRPREPTSSEDKARTRLRTSAKPWADGDQEPRFANPTVPIINKSPPPKPFTSAAPTSGPPNYESLVPPHLLASISSLYDIHSLNILAGAKINAKVTTLFKQLENGFSLGKRDQKPGVVALTAKASAANKLISVVEITKRELEKCKFKWFQYSAVASRVEDIKVKMSSGGKGANGGRTLAEAQSEPAADVDMQHGAIDLPQDDTDEEEAFETTVSREKPKVRSVPYLTIFMARVPVPQLKTEYGEQSYDPRKEWE